MAERHFHHDVFGLAALSWNESKSNDKIMIERDDGLVYADRVSHYFPDDSFEFKGYREGLLKYIQSPVLDIGCGPGRYAYNLWKKRFSVMGIDISRRVLQICSDLSSGEIPVVQMSINRLGLAAGHFRTILAMGHNIGAVGDLIGLHKLLGELHCLCSSDAKILLTSVDVTQIPDATYRAYFLNNKLRNRYIGQETMRLRYGNHFGEWFNWLFAAPDDMESIANRQGWTVEEFAINAKSPEKYAMVLGKL